MNSEEIIKFKSKRNDVFRQGNIVIKHFVSRDDYMNESLVYEKLSGTLLAPKLIEKAANCITTEYIEGISLFEELEASLKNAEKQTQLFKLFFDWYKRFQKSTSLILGDTNFRNFIIKEENLYGIDFETCKKGLPVEDLVWQTSMIATLRPAFSIERKKAARRFLSMGIQELDISTEDMPSILKQAFETICKRRNVELDKMAIREISSSVEVAACLLAGGKSSRMGEDKKLLLFKGETLLEIAAKNVALFAKKYLSLAAEESTIKLDGFENIPDQKAACGPMGGMVSTLAKVSEPWTLFVSCDMPLIDTQILDYLVSFRDQGSDAIMFSEDGRARIFPLLLRTKAALPILEQSLERGKFKLWHTLEDNLRISTLKIEDCPSFSKHSLKNINTKEDYEELESSQSKV